MLVQGPVRTLSQARPASTLGAGWGGDGDREEETLG